MNDLYHLIEFLLLVLLFFRILYQVILKSKRFNQGFVEILYFFVICLINHSWGYINPSSEYFFYFVHCAFPVVLPLSILNRSFKPRFIFCLIILVCLNLLIRDVVVIVVTYMIALTVIANRMCGFVLRSKNHRKNLTIYFALLMLLVCTNFTYLLGYAKMDWSHSQFINYFSFIFKFVYFSTILLGHVFLRRFIVD